MRQFSRWIWSGLLLPAALLLCAGCNLDQDFKEAFGGKKKNAAEAKTDKTADGKKTAAGAPAADKPAEKNAGGNPVVKLVTNRGEITIELDAKNAPLSTRNFLNYVETGFYDGTIFHRVIPNFMAQGGGFTPEMQEKKTGAPVKNEANNGLHNTRGTVAMARTQEVDSATSQFFINLKDNAFLDNGTRDFGYAVFGKVTAGMAVVDEIAKIQTGSKGGLDDVPQTPVVIEKAIRLR